MLFEDKERACIKYYCFLLEITINKIRELEKSGENSQELDDLYSNIYMWSDNLSYKINELWGFKE